MINNDYAEVKIFCKMQSQASVNVLHFRGENQVAAGVTEQEIADALSPIYAALLKPLLTSVANYAGLQVQKVAPLPEGAPFVSTSGFGIGLAGNAPLPKQTAAVIKKVTALAGRAYRGRMYVPFPDEGDNTTAAIPAPVYITTLGLLATEMQTPRLIVGAAGQLTLRLQVYNRNIRVGTPVVKCLPRQQWGTQRRRGDFGQANLVLPV